ILGHDDPSTPGTFRFERAAGGAPEASGFTAPWLPLSTQTRVNVDARWAPESWIDAAVAVAPVTKTNQVIVLGRDGGPRILDSELARLSHLIGLASTISSHGGQGERQDVAGTSEQIGRASCRERGKRAGVAVGGKHRKKETV